MYSIVPGCHHHAVYAGGCTMTPLAFFNPTAPTQPEQLTQSTQSGQLLQLLQFRQFEQFEQFFESTQLYGISMRPVLKSDSLRTLDNSNNCCSQSILSLSNNSCSACSVLLVPVLLERLQRDQGYPSLPLRLLGFDGRGMAAISMQSS